MNSGVKDPSDRILDLMDELKDHPEEDFLSGKMQRQWAEKIIDAETETEAAIVAFLQYAGCPKVIVEMIEKKVYRQRSTKAMKALKSAKKSIDEDRIHYVNKVIKEYLGEGGRSSDGG